jgi:hypothetical protein
MAIAESWHVRSRGRECAATQRPFTDGEIIVTALFPDPESSGYLRRDYCTEGWQTFQETGEKPFSFWRTKFAAPIGSETVNVVEKLSAEEILQRLVEEDEDHTENARFILAVMLERQKLLRETDSQRTPTGILRVYEHRKTGEVFIVKDPDIPLDQVEAVQQEVFVLLENNGRSPEKPEETPEAVAEEPAEGTSEESPADPESEQEIAPATDEETEAAAPPEEDASPATSPDRDTSEA